MTILIYQFSFEGPCDVSNEKVLELLHLIPETRGKRVDGEVQRFMIDALPEGIEGGFVYVIEEKTLNAPGVYVIFERMYERGDPDYEKAVGYRQQAASLMLTEVLSQFKIESKTYRNTESDFTDEITPFVDAAGHLGYHISVDNKVLVEAIMGPLKQEESKERTDPIAPDPEKFAKLYKVAATAQVDLKIEYNDGPRDFSISTHSPCEEEQIAVENTSFDFAADAVIEHLEKLQNRGVKG